MSLHIGAAGKAQKSASMEKEDGTEFLYEHKDENGQDQDSSRHERLLPFQCKVALTWMYAPLDALTWLRVALIVLYVPICASSQQG